MKRSVILRCLILTLSVITFNLWTFPIRAAEGNSGDDLGVGVSINAEHKLAKALKLELDVETRTQDGLNHLERWSFGLGLDYKLVKGIKADVGYVLIERYRLSERTKQGNVISGYWAPRHRWYVGVFELLEWHRWKISLRERYQLTHSPLQYVPKYVGTHCDCTDDWYGMRLTDEKKGGSQEHLLRSRLSVSYNIPHCKLTPSLSVEMLNDLAHSFDIDQLRYSLVFDYSLSKRKSLTLEWRYKDREDNDEADGHLIGLGYKFTF